MLIKSAKAHDLIKKPIHQTNEKMLFNHLLRSTFLYGYALQKVTGN